MLLNTSVNWTLVLEITSTKSLSLVLVSDFAMPLQLPGSQKSSSFTANTESLGMIMSMGFNTDQATKALKATVSSFCSSTVLKKENILSYSPCF